MLRTRLRLGGLAVVLATTAAAACAPSPTRQMSQYDPETAHWDSTTRTTTVPIRFLTDRNRILWADPVVVHPGEMLGWTAPDSVCSAWTVRFEPDSTARGGGTPLAGGTTVRNRADPQGQVAGSPGPGPIRRYKYDVECVLPSGADTIVADPEVIVDPSGRG